MLPKANSTTLTEAVELNITLQQRQCFYPSVLSSLSRLLPIPITPAKMPTPESPLFLARKPTVPPTFDGVDYDDTPRLKQAQDAIIREQWVKSMMARLVRDELGKCYIREGVNHLEKCGKLRGEFTSRGIEEESRRAGDRDGKYDGKATEHDG